jgi:nucleoside-diphosphate-sugar epimerase
MVTVSILGCGWFGMPLAQALVMDGNAVKGSTTRQEKLARLSEKRVRPYLVDLRKNILPDDFFQSDFLVVNVPPRSRTGGVDEYLNQMNLVAQQLRSSPIRRVVFISSTAVYPDLNKTVGENDGDPSSALYIAEQIFLNMKSPMTTVIRFAGLVGPGRHPGRFLSGKEVGGATTPVNIIHLDDCVAITRKILKAKINEHMVFNACADLHPTRKEFYAKMAELLRVPAPFFNDSVAAFKIVDSSRLKKFLNYEFIYNDPMQMDFQ